MENCQGREKFGEISVKNAHPAIRMLNTGHKGFFSTIHANSPLDALDGAFVQNVEMAGYPSNNISKWLHKYFDIVIHLESRKIVEIFLVLSALSRKFQ